MRADADTGRLVREAERIELEAFVDMYSAAPPEALARVERVADATLLIAPLLPKALFNRAIGLATTRPVAPGEIAAVADRYETAGSRKYFIHAGPTTHPDLVLQLRDLGFRPGEPARWAKTALLREPEPLESTVVARPIVSSEAVRFAEIIRSVFDFPPFMEAWIRILLERPGWTAFGAFDGDAMVAGGLRWQTGRDTWLGMAGSLPEARRRGAQGALLRARIAAAPGLVITETWLPPPGGHNSSLGNMHRAGFVTIAERLNFQRSRT